MFYIIAIAFDETELAILLSCAHARNDPPPAGGSGGRFPLRF
jgi:hypothetical protein